MKRYYDKVNKRLVYTGQSSDEAFWDRHWSQETPDYTKWTPKDSRFIIKQTGKYLQPGARIIEGGCGMGRHVYALCRNGYDARGIDYAVQTVEKVHRYVPDLDIQCGDVRCLPYRDGFFDGYWSLGVIEHFYDGFIPIIEEARRVLKEEGYLFVTCPYMNCVRRLKASLRSYPDWSSAQQDSAGFYQFALDRERTVREIEHCGFCLCSARPFDGVKGFKDEVPLGRMALQSIYDGKQMATRLVRKLLNVVLSRLAGHSILLVFRKRKMSQ